MQADGVRTPVALGLALDKLFHAVVPKVQCTACGVRRLDITSAGSRLQCPPDGLRVQVDVLQRRVVDMSLTDWLCRVYRKHWNQSALQATYVDLIGSALPYTTAAVNDNLRKIVFLYLKGGIPSARHLANIVLLSFQTHELPRLEEEVRWVCARFGAVIAVDGSSAPLQEARQYRRKQDRDHRRGDPGAALRALGLFDIPLCPTVFVRSEGRAAVAELVAFLVAQATMVDAEALPLGWVQDNTESMWATMVHVAQKLLHAHPTAMQVDYLEKRVSGFFVGIDPKHVEWRLQEALDARSADFLQAAWALRTLFSKLFNLPAEEGQWRAEGGCQAQDRDSPERDGRALFQDWLQNSKVGQSGHAGKVVFEAFLQAARGDAAALHFFRPDGTCPPRAVVSNFLAAMGCKAEQQALWAEARPEKVFPEDLDAFTAWFALPMAP